MTDVPLPEASLVRLRREYAALEETANIVAEAMGIPLSMGRHLDLTRGVFVIDDGGMSMGAERNGIAQEATYG